MRRPANGRTVFSVTTTQEPQATNSVIDTDFAIRCAHRLMPGGPAVSLEQAQKVVQQLGQCAANSVAPVAEVTGTTAPGALQVAVIDRNRWVTANVELFTQMLEPGLTELRKTRPEPHQATMAITRRITGAEVGSALAFLGSKVLGQYDPYLGATGQLYLVAPNIVAIEQKLDVEPADFRMWVCLHEETHRWQFGAAPWLKEYLLAQVTELIVGTLGTSGEFASRFRQAISGLPQVLRPGSNGLAEVFQNEEQQKVLARTTAVMSLLEGHADVIMDEAGKTHVASVELIRRRFTKYRKGRNVADVLTRRILGLEAKTQQYAAGAYFVRQVLDKVGMADFNTVFESPETLPTPTELAEPAQWVDRVLLGR